MPILERPIYARCLGDLVAVEDVLDDDDGIGRAPARDRAHTGASASSCDSKLSRSDRLKSRNHPQHRERSQTEGTSLSVVTPECEKSAAPTEFDIGPLRGHAVPSKQRDFSKDYEVLGDQLGEGGFGLVWRCQHRETKKHFAVKVISGATPVDTERFEQERAVFQRLNHPHVVRLHAILVFSEEIHLVMDLCLGGDLLDYTNSYGADAELAGFGAPMGLQWRQVARLIWQMLAAIVYLHHHRFCHRDIKLENFMIKEPGRALHLQLGDFGFSIRFEREVMLSGRCGTLMYIAPEVLQGKLYNEKCDVWSVGICSYIISAQRDPWGGSYGDEMGERIDNNDREPFPKHQPPELGLLVERMLVGDITDRPGAKEVFRRSSWLQKYGSSAKSTQCAPCTVS